MGMYKDRPRENNRRRDKQLNMRVDERLRFAVHFTAARRGMTMAQWLDQQIMEFIKDSGWEAYWHPSDAVREVLRIRYSKRVGTREEEIYTFLNDFNDLLFRDASPRVHVLDAIWPDIGQYVAAWKKDPMAVRELLKKAIVKLPKGAR